MTLSLPDGLFTCAQKNKNGYAILLPKQIAPNDITPNKKGVLDVTLSCSGKRFSMMGAQMIETVTYSGLRQMWEHEGTQNTLREEWQNTVMAYQHAWPRNPLEGKELHMGSVTAGAYLLNWNTLKPISGGPLAPENQQTLELGTGQFSALFFYPASRCVNEHPMPLHCGSIRLGDRTLKKGNVRFVEMNKGTPTGWEAQTQITSIWKGPLADTPDDFIEYAGFSGKKEMQRQMMELYRGLGREITGRSVMTAIKNTPALPENTGFRNPF